MIWPDNKSFAFSIFDDTDEATIENVPHVYALLDDLGFKTTKSVWPSRGTGIPAYGGDTCEDKEYLEWLLDLQKKGFEIGYHLNTFHSSTREEVIAGLERFEKLFGHSPNTMASHTGCADAIYWGEHRLSGLHRPLYNLLTRFRNKNKFRGHIEGDPHFWGDICRDKIRYCRNFVFPDINSLKMCPFMPYHDPDRPYVNRWFASSEGAHIESFNLLLSEANQDQLEHEGGACIVYTHLGCGFYEDGRLNGRFVELMKRLSGKNGWFAPVKDILDYLNEKNRGHQITAAERRDMERRWLKNRIFRAGRYNL